MIVKKKEPFIRHQEKYNVEHNQHIVNEYYPLHLSQYSKLMTCMGVQSEMPKDKYHFEANRFTVNFELSKQIHLGDLCDNHIWRISKTKPDNETLYLAEIEEYANFNY